MPTQTDRIHQEPTTVLMVDPGNQNGVIITDDEIITLVWFVSSLALHQLLITSRYVLWLASCEFE